MSSSDTPRRQRVRRRVLGVAALVVLAAGVGGCGFHLQGSVRVPEEALSVHVAASDELTPFAVALRQLLERSGAHMVASAAAADTVIRIARDRSGRRVLSVSVSNRPQEFEIFYAVEYSIDRAGKEVVARQTLERTRNFTFEESQLLAKDREEDVLREAMARDLANLVLRRLEAL